jgi:hypothetical protein
MRRARRRIDPQGVPRRHAHSVLPDAELVRDDLGQPGLVSLPLRRQRPVETTLPSVWTRVTAITSGGNRKFANTEPEPEAGVAWSASPPQDPVMHWCPCGLGAVRDGIPA